MPRPALTRARIVAAGVGIVGDMGLAALDVRAVARRVNATAISVQRQIGMTELVRSVATEILSSMPVPPKRGPWRSRTRAWAIDTRGWLRDYPGMARYLLANRWDVPMGLDRLEELVGILIKAGVSAAQSVVAARAIYWYVLSSADLDESARLGVEFSQETVLGSANRWPILSTEAVDYSEVAALAQFTLGLDLMLEGIDRLSGSSAVRVAEQHLANSTEFTVPSR